jgi:hypothetical protein
MDFPVRGALQPSQRGYYNAFVAKLSADGSTLLLATYLGGTFEDYGYGLALAPDAGLYIVGQATSLDFPVRNALYPRPRTDIEGETARSAFVAKLSLSGDALIYSTLLGCTTPENSEWRCSVGYCLTEARDVAVDSDSNAYVTGYTNDPVFPTANAFQPQPGRSDCHLSDAFVAKLNPSGSLLVFSTYLGGYDRDDANGIAVDSAGNVYVTGSTESADFPTSPTAFQRDLRSVTVRDIVWSCDAFVTKLSASGSQLVYSTYLGGGHVDSGNDIAVDGDDNAYVCGWTRASDFPLPANPDGSLDRTLNGDSDAFVAKLSPGGSALLYSTYLGGSDGDDAHGLALDAAGAVYVTGDTRSADFPVTADAWNSLLNKGVASGAVDSYVVKLDMAQNELDYATYFGGADTDRASTVAVDAAGSIYVGGDTISPDLDTTEGAFDRTYAGGTCGYGTTACYDGFVFKLGYGAPPPPVTVTPTPTHTPTPTRTPTHTPTPRPPIVESVDPASAGQGINVDVTIYGYFFQPGASALVGQSTLRQVQFLGPETAPPHRWRLKGMLPGGLAAGQYDVTVLNPDGQSAVLSDGFTVRPDYERGLGPATVSYGAYTWTGVGSYNYPVLNACRASIVVEEPIYGDPPASVVLVDGKGTVVATLSRVSEITGGGLYRGAASSEATEHGTWSWILRKVATWPDGETLSETVFGAGGYCLDPSGRVYDVTTSAPVEGAVVTLMSRGTGGDVLWNAALSGQLNPQTTNAQGRYGWETTAGNFYVLVSKACYADAESRVVTVPPPVTDLDVGLTSRDCSPVSMGSAQATGADGRPVDLVPPGAPLRLLARIINSSAAGLSAQAETTADYRLELLDARGEPVPGLTQTGSVPLTPGENTLELEGTAPSGVDGEYTFGAWVTYDQQTTFRGYKFRVGVGRARMTTHLPLIMKGSFLPAPSPTPTRTGTLTTATPTRTPTSSASPTMTPTPTVRTPTPTRTPTRTPTLTPIPTATPTATPPPGLLISGVVQSCLGQRLAGATVTLEGTGYAAQTDAAGQYRIGPIPDFLAGDYVLTASAAGHASRSVTLSLPETGTRQVNFVGTLCLQPLTVTDTPTPTGTATTTPTATSTPSPTPTATVTPGLTVRGHVRLNSASGPGVPNVAIHLYFAGYAPGPVVATTNAEGYYETSFFYIPGDETVTLWPELPGYTFEPPQHYWRHYYGVENAVRDFIAYLTTSTPTVTATPTRTRTSTPTPTPTPTTTPGVVTVDRAWTTDASGGLRMAFVAGDKVKLWLQLTNSGSSPASAEVAWEVVGHGGYFVEALSWTGTLSVPPGSTAFNIERTVPADAPWGPYTFMGYVTDDPIAGPNAELYLGTALRLADDFSNPASGWPSGDTTNVAYGYLSGEYRIWIKVNDWWMWTFPGITATDFALEADVRMSGTGTGSAALMFGMTPDASGFYIFGVTRDGRYALYRRVSGSWFPLVSWTASPAVNTGETSNHLMVVQQAGQVSLYANGTELTTVLTSPAPSGRLGLYAEGWQANLDARFDNFRVYGLGGAGLTGETVPARTARPDSTVGSEPPAVLPNVNDELW